MAQLNEADFESKYNDPTSGYFKTNNTKAINSQRLRYLVEDLPDSFLNLLTLFGSYIRQADAFGINDYTATIALSPTTVHSNGALIMLYFENDSTGPASAIINGSTRKIFLDLTTQAGAGDLHEGLPYLFIYKGELDSDAGGWLIVSRGSSSVPEEFNRAFTQTPVFDKNEVYYAPYVQTGELNFSLAGSGHLVNNSSSARMTITFNGDDAINFSSEFNELIGFENGDIIPAGTRKVYLIYVNGEVSVNIPGVSSQPSGITKLSTPGSFAVVADGENALDMSWADVDNETGYQVEKSLNGSTGWVLYSNPAAEATSDTETGLNPGDIIYYRIKAIGDGTIYSDSNYAYANGQTENSGDTTPPTFTYEPVTGEDEWSVNKAIIVTASEPIRTDSGTELTSANAGTYFNVKETNSGGANIPGTWSVNSAKTVFTFTPTSTYGASQVVYVGVHDVEDMDGNELVGTDSITFTTTAYTYYNGTTNRLQFGDLGDSVWAVADINFWLEVTIKNHALSGTRVLWAKSDISSNQRSWFLYTQDTDIYFNYYGNGVGSAVRSIKWTGALAAGEQTLVLKYNGALDTNDGLDRAVLEIDGVVVGSKTVAVSGGVLTTILLAIVNSSAYLSFGNLINSSGVPGAAYWFSGEAKDLVVRTVNGTNVWLNVPVVSEGTDTSGNGRHGTWV